MGRPRGLRTASMEFQRTWDVLDDLRERSGQERETIADKVGFSRSSWFAWAKNGHVPFCTLERIAERLKARIRASVETGASDTHDTHAGHVGTTMNDPLDPIRDMIDQYPEEHREKVVGAILLAARQAVRDLPPFVEPPAGHRRPGRGRK